MKNPRPSASTGRAIAGASIARRNAIYKKSKNLPRINTEYHGEENDVNVYHGKTRNFTENK